MEEKELAAVRVCVRVRPLLSSELAKGEASTRMRWDASANRISVQGRPPRESLSAEPVDANTVGERTFDFDRVFGPETGQDIVFEDTGFGSGLWGAYSPVMVSFVAALNLLASGK